MGSSVFSPQPTGGRNQPGPKASQQARWAGEVSVLPRLQLALVWGASRSRGRAGVWGMPLHPQSPLGAGGAPGSYRKALFLSGRCPKHTWLLTRGRGGRERGGKSEKTPLQAAFIQNAFPDVSLWPVGAPSAHCSVYR